LLHLFTEVRRRGVLRSSWVRGSRKCADAEECVTRILSLKNVGWDMDSEETPMRKVLASEIVSLDGVVESPEKWPQQGTRRPG
jgi:hypothetical protein